MCVCVDMRRALNTATSLRALGLVGFVVCCAFIGRTRGNPEQNEAMDVVYLTDADEDTAYRLCFFEGLPREDEDLRTGIIDHLTSNCRVRVAETRETRWETLVTWGFFVNAGFSKRVLRLDRGLSSRRDNETEVCLSAEIDNFSIETASGEPRSTTLIVVSKGFVITLFILPWLFVFVCMSHRSNTEDARNENEV